MQALKSFLWLNCITLIFSDVVPQSKLTWISPDPLCCLTLSLVSLFSFQGAISSKQTPLPPFPAPPLGSAENFVSLCCFSSSSQTHFIGLCSDSDMTNSDFSRSEISSRFLKSLFLSLNLRWWARVGSNHRPYDYQSYALAS